jgi:hypothetical protein
MISDEHFITAGKTDPCPNQDFPIVAQRDVDVDVRMRHEPT